MEQILIDDLKEEYERSAPTASACWPSPTRTCEPQAGLLQGRRERPGPKRLRRLPRPAQGDRRAGHRGPAAARRRGQGPHRRQRAGQPQDLPARSACRPSTCCWAAQVEAMTDAELAEAAEKATLFARLSPAHKQRIIKALQSQRARGRVPGRRHQRRPGAARGRRGHLRGHRRGHRQGIGRRHPAGKEPDGAGGGRARRPQGLRQHPQVRPHGRQLATSATCSACSAPASSCRSCRWRRSRS